jgi:hypothetical protein
MKINNSSDCTGSGGWETFAAQKAWSLPTIGASPVSVLFRDNVGNVSSCVSTSIFYDDGPPATPSSLTLESGFASTDNKNPISIRVASVIPGDSVKVYKDSLCEVEVGHVTAGNLGYAIVPISLPSAGHYDFYAKAFDPDNLESSCSTASITYNYDIQAPTVSHVTSTLADGSYTTGAMIDVSVHFSEPVDVVGSGAKVVLDFNGTPRAADYLSGSGTSVLHFQYMAQVTDFSSDLDYESSSSLELGSATIKDVAGNIAVLNLPNPGAAGSLGSNKAIQINSAINVQLATGFNAVDNKSQIRFAPTISLRRFRPEAVLQQ